MKDGAGAVAHLLTRHSWLQICKGRPTQNGQVPFQVHGRNQSWILVNHSGFFELWVSRRGWMSCSKGKKYKGQS